MQTIACARCLSADTDPHGECRIQTARFVVKGIVPQALEALARMHEAGYAHRVLSSACIQLSAKQGMNKNVALENCDPSMLTIKLNDLARATPLSDTSAPRGAPGLIAEDLSILGFILLQLFLTALAETKTIDPKTGLAAPIASPPALSIADLRRQLALFDGRLAGSPGVPRPETPYPATHNPHPTP